MARLIPRWGVRLAGSHPAQWLARRPWTLALVTWVALAVPGFVVVSNNNSITEETGRRTDVFVKCLTEWANESADRTRALTNTRKPLDDAERAVLLAAAHADREGLVRGLADYKTASEKYEADRELHPVPDAPSLRCRQ